MPMDAGGLQAHPSCNIDAGLEHLATVRKGGEHSSFAIGGGNFGATGFGKFEHMT